MLADLNRVDFTNVQEQASWVCGCDLATVTRYDDNDDDDFESTNVKLLSEHI